MPLHRRAALAALLLVASPALADGEVDLETRLPANPTAFIPPACYTRTLDAAGGVHNPCFTCHTASKVPNFVNDDDLQLSYDFPDPAAINRWSNLFVDRRPGIAAQSDSDILNWVRTDNYRDGRGGITLREELAKLPAAWDVDEDGSWSGFVPDVYFDFDAHGFDHAPDGQATGWRAYAYYPLPGGFWPTNGSADDVAIRLPLAFRRTADGRPDDLVYRTNLAIVEALAKQADVAIPPTDERVFGVDLDRDGKLDTATRIAFAFDPRQGVTMSYVGEAKEQLEAGDIHLAAGLLPEGTELVHSLRYLDVAPDGSVVAAPRMKELRYARKIGWHTYPQLQDQALGEIKEAHDFPDRLRVIRGDSEHGLGNGQGWIYQGFIEAADGSLRPQSFEESMTCIGCHSGIGRTADGVFSLARKVDDPAHGYGWYYWSARPLGDLPDRDGEYVSYLRRNGAGDEFRSNEEVQRRFFDASGHLEASAAAALAQSIASLVMPSPERALTLDKAYRLIVEEQSYAQGRNPVIAPLDRTVHRTIEPGEPTGIEEAVN